MKRYRKIFFYNIGIFILACGCMLTIKSNFGAGPFDALLVGLYKTFGLTIGSWEIVLGLILVLLNALGSKLKPEYFALITSLITGVCIDFWIFTAGVFIEPQTLVFQTICFFIGLVLMCLGVALNIQADFAPNPMDRSMIVLSKLLNCSFSISRAVLSFIFVIFAFIFEGPILIGTVIVALFAGIIIKFFIPYVHKFDLKYFS